MDSSKNLSARIKEYLNTLTTSQKIAAEYIIRNIPEVAFSTVNELSKKIGVSESTVVRLVRSLKYSNYADLQKEVQRGLQQNGLNSTFSERLEMFKTSEDDNSFEVSIKNDVNRVMKLLDPDFYLNFDVAVTKIKSAKKLFVFGCRSSGYIAGFFAYFLNYMRPNVIDLSRTQNVNVDVLVDCKKGDVFLVVGMSRYSMLTIEMMKVAKKQGAFVISITDSIVSPVATLSDLTMACETGAQTFFWSASSVSALINIILKAMVLPDDDVLKKRFQKLENLLDENHVFVNCKKKG